MSNVILVEEIQKFADKIGHFPTYKDFYFYGKKRLLSKVRYKKLKLSNIKKNSKFKLDGRKNWTEQIIRETIKELITKLGKFPTKQDIVDHGFGGMFGKLKKINKTVSDYAPEFGIKRNKKINGYWSNWDNLKSELELLINKNGSFPSLLNIEKSLGGCAKKNILQLGGIKNVALKMGYNYMPRKTYRTSSGVFVHSLNEFLFAEFLDSRKIPYKTNERITLNRDYKFDFKIENYYFEIWGYSPNCKSKIGLIYNQKRKLKENLYKDLNLNLISIEGKIFSKFKETIKHEFIKILKSINLEEKYPEIYEFNILENIKKLRKYDEKSIELDLMKIIKEIGHFPTQLWMRKQKRYSLLEGILAYGGAKYFAKKMGYKIYHKEKTL